MKFNFFQKLLKQNLILLVFFSGWLLLGFLELLNPVFVPTLPKIVVNTFDLLLQVDIWEHIYSSLKIIMTGFVISVAVALPLGIGMGLVVHVNELCKNFIELIRPISPLALYPLFIFFFGIGFMSKLAIVFWVTWIPILLNTIIGVQKIDVQYIRMAKIAGANKWQLLKEIIIPASSPYIITGMRLAAGSALLVIVAAEMIGSNTGIGFFILNASYTFQILDIYSGIIVIAVIGIIINYFFLALEKKMNY